MSSSGRAEKSRRCSPGCSRLGGVARPGRRPLDPHDPAVSMTVRVPSKEYDALGQLAAQQRVSLSTLARVAFRRLLKAADLSHQGKP